MITVNDQGTAYKRDAQMGLQSIFRRVVVVLIGLFINPIHPALALETPEWRAAQWLTAQQNVNGSWGAFEDLQSLYTTNAVRALGAIYQRNAAYYKGIAWLENHHVPNVDYTARRILALATRGNNVQPDLDYLRTAADVSAGGNNGWGLTEGYRGSPIDTAVVLQAFSRVGEQTHVQAALNYLKATQLSGTTKGWPVSYEASNDPNVTSDPISTALVLQALLPYAATDSTLATPISNAVATLEAMVNLNSPTLTRAYAALGLLQENIESPHGQLLLDSLRVTQLSSGIHSGSWDGEIYTTTVALQALAVAAGADLAAQADLVFIPDVNLRKAINSALGKNHADSLTKGELAQLTELIAPGLGIQNLTGLEWAVNLRSADLSSNQIADIRPLQFLANLESVYLHGNPLSAIADSDGDGAADAEEAFAGTHPFLASDHPLFHVDHDPLNLQSLQAALSGEGQLTDAWHAVWEDLDGDGDLDVLIYVHGADEQGTEPYHGRTRGQLWVFEQVNDAYVQRSFNAGEDQPNGEVSALYTFDYDNNGVQDVLMVLQPVTTTDAQADTTDQHRDVVLFKSESTSTVHLTDVTQAVGLPGPAVPGFGERSAAVLDLNRDGYLDIFVASPTSDRFWQFDPVSQTYQDVMASTGLPAGLCCELVTVDVDNDGAVDVVSAGGANVLRLFQHDGVGSFTELANPSAASLAPLNNLTEITKLMPVDYNRDGLQDLVVFHTQLSSESPPTFAGGSIHLVKNLSTTGQFDLQLDTAVTGFDRSGSAFDFSYGGTVGDVDNDGDVDYLITSLEGTEWTTVYRQNGDGSVTRLGARTNLRHNGNRSPQLGDVTENGRLDLLLPSGYQGGYADYLYTNLASTNQYLKIYVIGKTGAGAPSSGQNAVGAQVKVEADGGTQWQQVLIGSGPTQLLHFGLGPATSATVTVYWPSGTPPTTMNVPSVNQVVLMIEP